jgi:anti-anti-sigma regulatory factor
MSAMAIGILMKAHREAIKRNSRFAVCGLRDELRSLFVFTCFTPQTWLFDDCDEAPQALKRL